ncbi:MAG TPA: hypothetical protein VLK35_13600 [Methylomirabilota bacterium]|nr:hypothetical protein [Methylomirabilota bacterium]
MERHARWFQLVAAVLVVVGLLTLAAPAPAQAMDPQLILALASTAGAIALIVGYLIVANGREKERAASLEGIYRCSDQEAAGPMGCGGPVSAGFGPASVIAAATESPMGGMGPRTDGPTGPADACPADQAAGPMGCGAAGSGYPTAAPTAVSPLEDR